MIARAWAALRSSWLALPLCGECGFAPTDSRCECQSGRVAEEEK